MSHEKRNPLINFSSLGLLVALWALLPLEAIKVRHPHIHTFLLLALATLGVLAGYAFAKALWIWSRPTLGAIRENLPILPSHYLYDVRPAAFPDLPHLFRTYQRTFPNHFPRADKMRAWMERSGTCFVMVDRVMPDGSRQWAGSFKLLPLSAKGVHDLEMGYVTGSSFNPEHLSRSRRYASGLYVGDLHATHGRDFQGVVNALDKVCSKYQHLPIYGRPVSRHGRKVMEERSFVDADSKVKDLRLNCLCRRDPTQDSESSGALFGLKRSLRRGLQAVTSSPGPRSSSPPASGELCQSWSALGS